MTIFGAFYGIPWVLMILKTISTQSKLLSSERLQSKVDIIHFRSSNSSKNGLIVCRISLNPDFPL